MDQLTRNNLFRGTMKIMESEYPPFEITRWFCLGAEQRRNILQMRTSLNRKLRPEGDATLRGSSYQDALAIQLLAFLDSEGYDLESIRFNESGELQSIGKRPIESTDRASYKHFHDGE